MIITLLAAALVAPLVGGRWNVPVAAWLLPAFLLVAGDRLGSAQAWLVTLAVLSLGGLLSLAGQVPLPLPGYVAYVVATEAVNALAYLAGHAGLAATSGFAGTLAFPAAVLAIEAVTAAASPFGRWGSLAYTQYGNLPLTQVAAFAGNPAITLLVCWFGASLAWTWVHGFAPDRVRTALLAYGIVLAAVLLAGGVRLARSRRAGRTVRIASLTEPELPGVPPVSEIFGQLVQDRDQAQAGAEGQGGLGLVQQEEAGGLQHGAEHGEEALAVGLGLEVLIPEAVEARDVAGEVEQCLGAQEEPVACPARPADQAQSG